MNGCESPCLNCPDREVGCHGKCDKYKEFRAKLDKINEKMRRETLVFDIEPSTRGKTAFRRDRWANKRPKRPHLVRH